MAFLNMLLSGVTNPRVLVSLIVAMLMVLVWMQGPRWLGLKGVWLYLTLVAMGLALAVVQFLWSRRSQREKDRAAIDLENSLIMEADATVADAAGDDKAAREEARRELVAAIDVIKNSRLADGTSSKAALYVLPWYLVLGTPGSGKSAVIRHSGLQRPGQGPGELRGIGASSHCEWWFTNHAVVLEADRRFAERAGAPGADGSWKAFLRSLGKQRPRTSLNGVIVTVAADELLGCAAGDVEERARLLRQRLDATMATLKQVFPVYLVVTKLDLVHGFGEYFAELPEAASQQIFGATMRAPHMRSSQPERVFAHEFERLYTVLCRRRQRRLAQDDSPARRDGTYLFPLEFRALGDNLSRFVRLVFEDDVYGQSPLMRGFYFAATGGDGSAAEAVLARVDRELGLPQEGGGHAGALAGARPHFLKDLFRRVIVPDRGIARPTRRVARRMRLVRRVLQTAVLGALGVLLVLLCVSFANNLGLARSTARIATQAAKVRLTQETRAGITEKLEALEEMRRHLVHMDELDDGRGLVWGLGLYHGTELNRMARQVYLDRIYRILAMPSRAELEPWLMRHYYENDVYPTFEARYRAYRMLVDPEYAEADVLVPVLRDVWNEAEGADRPASQQTIDLVENHVRFAVEHKDDLRGFANPVDPPRQTLIDSCNGQVQDQWSPETYYRTKIDEINALERQELEFSLARVRGATTILEADLASRADGGDAVPAAFTKEGWRRHIHPFIAESDTMVREDWLLRDVFKKSNLDMRERLLDLYLGEYREHWNAFLASVRVRRGEGVSAARDYNQELAQRDSPYYEVLRQVYSNVNLLDGSREPDGVVREMVADMTADFRLLSAFEEVRKQGDEEVVPLDLHLQDVVEIGDALRNLMQDDIGEAAWGYTKKVYASRAEGPFSKLINMARDFCLLSRESEGARTTRLALASYLKQPALAGWEGCLRETEKYLDGRWRDVVYGPFDRNLRGKFPIDPQARNDEVSLEDFGAFWGRNGALHGFYTEYLADYLTSERGEPKVRNELKLALSPAVLRLLAKGADIRESLFKDTDTEPRLRFVMEPRPMNSVGSRRVAPDRSQFTFGTKQLSYDFGQYPSQTFVWPEPDGNHNARVEAWTVDKEQFYERETGGAWSVLRLFYDANIVRSRDASHDYEVMWNLSRDGAEIQVPYVIRVLNLHHPLDRDWFEVDCPERLHR